LGKEIDRVYFFTQPTHEIEARPAESFADLNTFMPQFFYRIQPTRLAMLTEGATEAEACIIGEHFNYLGKLVAEGVVLMAGRTLTKDEKTFGIVIFAAASEAEAGALMQNDPALKLGVMTAELFPYRVALWSPTFSVAEED
jgi:uncharacterized protein YciI